MNAIPEQLDENQVHQQLLARQPIFDRDLNVYGYELLFRDHDNAITTTKDSNYATYSVVLNAYTDLGLERIVNKHFAFINVTADTIKAPPPVSPEQVVFEVPLSAQQDSKLLPALESLKEKGFRIVLDNFMLFEGWEKLAEIADFIKIDIQCHSNDELQRYVEVLKPIKGSLIAAKVETHAQCDQCLELNFDYFQGHFFSTPKLVTGKEAPSNQIVTIKLLAELSNPEVHFNDIERIVSADPKLSIKILKIINSSAFTKAAKIESLKQALVYMGIEKLKSWIAVIILQTVEIRTDELLYSTLLRARMCEELAVYRGLDKTDQYFTCGLFSNLDAMFDQDLDEIIAEINLCDELATGILFYEGTLGETLKDVVSFEKGHWDTLSGKLKTQEYSEAYHKSLEWTQETFKSISSI